MLLRRTKHIEYAQGNVLAVYERRSYGDGSEELYLTEQHIYGSARLGMRKPNLLLATYDKNTDATLLNPDIDLTYSARVLGEKEYELTNHLGNVITVVSDKRNGDEPDVISASDYYPYGMLMPGRTYDAEEYRYGFNGKEDINELNGWQDYGERMYSPLTARFQSPDPIIAYGQQYPELSSYQFASNTPIWAIDLEGLEGVPTTKTVFVYYAGYDYFDLWGLLGHTAAGVYNPYDPNRTTFYAPFSGHDGQNELRKYDYGDVYGYSEGNTIKYYLDHYNIVQRIHYKVSDDTFQTLESIIDNNARNSYDGQGEWCTLQVNNAYYEAFKGGGLSDKDAHKAANKIIYYSLPKELSKKDVIKTGSTRYDKFYKKDDKYYHENNMYNSENNEWITITNEIKDFNTYFSTQEKNEIY